MESNRPKKIIEGFENDFTQITSEFSRQSPSLRLDDFFRLWSEMRMDLIFANRYDPRELLESILELNKRLVSIVTNYLAQDLESRTVSLYFLLCLFEKQPKRLRQRIRLTPDDAVSIQGTCQQVKQLKFHSDASFAWYHLRKARAIDFVEERLIYGPSMLTHRGAREVEESHPNQIDPVIESRRDSIKFIENKIEPTIAEFESVYTNYEKIKDMLKLNDINDTTVEFESQGDIRGFLDQAKTLIEDYKAETC